MAAAAAESTAALDLRVALGRLLGEHAFLLMEATRVDASSTERDAFNAALADNAGAISDTLTAVHGERAASAFSDMWKGQIALLLDYADAVRTGDDSSRRSAEKGLRKLTGSLAGQFAALMPGIDADNAAKTLRAHVDQIRAFSGGEYADAYAAHRAAFGHIFALGDTLALEIVRENPDLFPDAAAAFSPRVDLRLALDRLLGEHLILAALAMRAGVRDEPDFDAAGASLDDNTDELVAAIGAIYGPEVGAQFRNMWSAHVTAYIDFVQALGTGDEAGRAASLATLHEYHEQLATLLADVNPLLVRDTVADLIRRHIQALITQAEATQAGDPARAIAATRVGYDGTFEVGAVVADAVARQFPDRYRDLRVLPPTDVAPLEAPFARWIAVGAALLLSLGIQGALLARLRRLRSPVSRPR